MKGSTVAVVLFLAFLSLSRLAVGQGIEISGLTGYQFAGKSTWFEGTFRVQEGQNFGLALSAPIRSAVDIEASWTFQNTKLTFQPSINFIGTIENIEEEANVHYFHIGTLKPFMEGGRFVPFGLFSLGASWLDIIDNSVYEDQWRFSVNLGAGAKVFLTDRFGLRFQGRLMMPMYFNGISVGCGIGTGGAGCGSGVSSTVVLIQGDLQGGVILKLSK